MVWGAIFRRHPAHKPNNRRNRRMVSKPDGCQHGIGRTILAGGRGISRADGDIADSGVCPFLRESPAYSEAECEQIKKQIAATCPGKICSPRMSACDMAGPPPDIASGRDSRETGWLIRAFGCSLFHKRLPLLEGERRGQGPSPGGPVGQLLRRERKDVVGRSSGAALSTRRVVDRARRVGGPLGVGSAVPW